MSRPASFFHRLSYSTLHVLFPPSCAVCGRTVGEGSRICAGCSAEMEPVRLAKLNDNVLTRLFAPCGKVVRAASLLRYHPDTLVAQLLTEIKYHRRPQLALHLGEWMAGELAPRGMFKDIDALIPLPLTPKRQQERGYNQSERLACGISRITGIPVRTDIVERISFSISQTRLTGDERRKNVQQAFRPTEAYLQLLSQGKGLRHPLFIDDVITTGASLSALTVAVAPPEFSILSLALAGHHSLASLSEDEIQRETSADITRTTVYFDE